MPSDGELIGTEHPLFQVVTTTAGALSILNKELGEIMHNPVGPWSEANALYIEQSRFKSRWLEPDVQEFVVYDVGLGAAANALAALACIRSHPRSDRKFRLVSFERDLELLRFALLNARYFDHFKGYEAMITALLEKRTYTDASLTWVLHEGDALEALARESSKPHLVFFDPYSPKVNQEMWTTDCFRRFKERARSIEEGGTVLFTYSQATPIRVALFQAGFYVGCGTPTGHKEQTTQAATHLSLLDEPLGLRWFDRWKTSHTPYPLGARTEEHAEIRELILNHEQFEGLSREIPRRKNPQNHKK